MRRRNLLFTLPPILADCNTKTTQHGWRDVRPIALRRRVKLAGMSTVTLEVVETQDQWRRAVALRNAYNPDGPITVERAMNYAAAMNERVPQRRLLLSREGVDLACASVVQQYWTPFPECFSCQVMLSDSDEGAEEAIDACEEAVLDLGGMVATSWYRTDRPVLRDALLARGYEEGQRNPVACLELSGFDAAPWLARREGVLAGGYEIVDVATFAERHPETWKSDLWRLEMDIFQDVPLPEPFQEVPFEDWVRDLDANPIRFDWQFFALWGGQPVALSQLLPNWVVPTLFHTGLTGVRREHRRRGLASALKGHALASAKGAGVERVYTDNEENNPMFGLNLALGFRQVYESVHTRRTLLPAKSE